MQRIENLNFCRQVNCQFTQRVCRLFSVEHPQCGQQLAQYVEMTVCTRKWCDNHRQEPKPTSGV